jgi:hypothetical protein
VSAFEVLGELTRETVEAAARRHMARLESLAEPSCHRVVDKLPDNFRMIGLIALFWPGARVIVCQRDLRDIAVSCWQNGFQNLRWSNDWSHIARRFADYQQIMAHWQLFRTVDWFEIEYESLVRDVESQGRRLIEFVGLDWEPACLDFHLTRRHVTSASLVQVRQNVHTRSIGRWRHYEAQLIPFLRLAEEYGVRLTGSAEARVE